jgi:hypothetical protein
MLVFGLVYVTWALHGFFARVAHLVVADGSISKRGKRLQTIKGGTDVERFQKSDFPLGGRSSALGSRRVVLDSSSGLEEGIGSCAGIHLSRLCISKLSLTLAQRRTVCAVFSEKVSVVQA